MSIDECQAQPALLHVTAGKVFNAFSRAKILTGYSDGTSLRRQLLFFIAREIRRMALAPDDRFSYYPQTNKLFLFVCLILTYDTATKS